MFNRIVIAPHIDDEVIGASAVLDSETLVFYIGVDEFHIVDSLTRIREAKASSEIGGYHLRFAAKGNYVVNNYEKDFGILIEDLEQLFRQETPNEVFLPWPSYNQDHQTVYDAAMVALRPHDNNHFVKRVFLYEEPDCFWQPRTPFVPNYFKGLDLERKLSMYGAMPSQVRSYRSKEHLSSLAKVRGAACGYEFAEAYNILRIIE